MAWARCVARQASSTWRVSAFSTSILVLYLCIVDAAVDRLSSFGHPVPTFLGVTACTMVCRRWLQNEVKSVSHVSTSRLKHWLQPGFLSVEVGQEQKPTLRVGVSCIHRHCMCLQILFILAFSTSCRRGCRYGTEGGGDGNRQTHSKMHL